MGSFPFPVTFTSSAAGVLVALGEPVVWTSGPHADSNQAERALFEQIRRWKARARARY